MKQSNPDRETTILLADDDPLLVELVGSWLRSADFEVLEASDSSSALQMCIAQEPQLAIIDYQMPGHSGVDLARFIHSQTNVSLIFLSSHDEPEIIGSAISAGAFAYLVKPVTEDQLLHAVRAALERSREMRDLRERSSNLGNALQTARTVSIAIGLLMGRFRITQDDAFSRLRQQARSNRKRIEEVATELLQASEQTARLFRSLADDPHGDPAEPRRRPVAKTRTP